MRRSKVQVYLHLVWATSGRASLLEGPLERMVHRSIESEARKKGCTVLAIGGMPDHVHLAVTAPATLAPADLAHQVKGASSHLARTHQDGCAAFAWQSHYGVFSFSARDRTTIIDYVRGQRARHGDGTAWASLEATDEETPEAETSVEPDGTPTEGPRP